MNVTPAHILLIEDSDTQAMKLTFELEEEGWQVTRVATGEEGLQFLTDQVPDLVLVDYFLPGMQGDAFCRQARMKPNGRRLPLLILTETDSTAPQAWVRDSGANDYLSKSTDFEILRARIERMIDISRSRG